MVKLSKKLLDQNFYYEKETGVLYHRTGPNAGRPAGCKNKNGYLIVTKFNKVLYVHRIIAQMILSVDLIKFCVSHKNNIVYDNRESNLLILPVVRKNIARLNDKRRTLKYRGIVKYGKSNLFQAKIQVSGKTYRGKPRETQLEAWNDYCKLFVSHHGFVFCPEDVMKNYLKIC